MMSRFSVALVFLLACACGPSAPPEAEPDAGLPAVDECPAGTQTDLVGVVTAPNGIDPVPGALVYVPTTLVDYPPQVSCEVCGDTEATAKVSTTTSPDGRFTLARVPTAKDQPPGTVVTVVVQKGRFRRVSQVPIQSPCGRNDLAADAAFRLPKRHVPPAEHLPKIAVAVGLYDQMECVLRDMGLDEDQFGPPSETTRIHLYEGTHHENVVPLPPFSQLLNDSDLLHTYNVVFVNCGNEAEALLGQAEIRDRLASYVAAGGRLYVTDQAYDFVEQVFPAPIDFAPGQSSAGGSEEANAAEVGDEMEGIEAQVADEALLTWLRAVEERANLSILTGVDTVHITHFLAYWAMQLAVAADPAVKAWIHGPVTGEGGALSGDLPLTTTFDHEQCGRVLYSSYHTLGRSGGLCGYPDFGFPACAPFPEYCRNDTATLTPQERVLEYLIFHVADCVAPIE